MSAALPLGWLCPQCENGVAPELDVCPVCAERARKICPWCSLPFIPSRRDQIYCQPDCRTSASHERVREETKTQKPLEPRRCGRVDCEVIFVPRMVTQRYHRSNCRWVQAMRNRRAKR